MKIYHYHVNHLGTPQELSDESGNIIWLSYDRAWGGSFDSLYRQQFVDNWAVTENELQPFKFQGQCLDTETGLHYNRFRYYDSDVGMFISRDPIGLLGGSNVFQYAPNPIGWIDPWGLSCWQPNSNKNKLWSKGKLSEHLDKHGAEFDIVVSKDVTRVQAQKLYTEKALDFAQKPNLNNGSILDRVEDGAFKRFEPSTNTVFVGTEKGTIKTFYKWDGRTDDDVVEGFIKRGDYVRD